MNIKESIAEKIAAHLLRIEAVALSPDKPFTWASGMRSPIYCDNRVTLSFPDVRSDIKMAFAEEIGRLYPSVQKIAGIATGAIAHGALVADEMGLPFVYIRSKPKEHGKGNLIEGRVSPGEKIVVIEDLVSTGSSSLPAIQALRDAGCEVLCLMSIFTYGFEKAYRNFSSIDCPWHSLSNYSVLLDMAAKGQFISSEQRDALAQWYQNPEVWSAEKSH